MGENHRANHIARKQVGRELDALEFDAEGLCQAFDEERLGQSRASLEQDVAICEQGDEHALDHLLLADHGLSNFCRDAR